MEWPLKPLAGTMVHRSIELRLATFPIGALLAVLLYQGTNSALYYLLGIVIYFWAYSEGEVCLLPLLLLLRLILTRLVR